MKDSSGPGSLGEKITDDFSAPGQVAVSRDSKEQPEWLVRELLKQNRRRHSIALGDQAQIMRHQAHTIDSPHSLQVQSSKAST